MHQPGYIYQSPESIVKHWMNNKIRQMNFSWYCISFMIETKMAAILLEVILEYYYNRNAMLLHSRCRDIDKTGLLLRSVLEQCNSVSTWWRHQMETFFALLAICAWNSLVIGDFPAQRLVTRSFDVLFDLCPNERFRKQSRGWWFQTPWRPLGRHCND